TATFPSNWELSTARAASVVHVLADQGVDPGRLAVVGYGEHQPVAGNDTVEGRNANRRVLLVILAAPDGVDAVPESGRDIAMEAAPGAPAVAGAPAEAATAAALPTSTLQPGAR